MQAKMIAGMAKPSPTHTGDPTLIAIGRAIKELRNEAGLSQETLANKSSVDRSYMGGIERGEHNFSIISLSKICNSLNISLSALMQKANL